MVHHPLFQCSFHKSFADPAYTCIHRSPIIAPPLYPRPPRPICSLECYISVMTDTISLSQHTICKFRPLHSYILIHNITLASPLFCNEPPHPPFTPATTYAQAAASRGLGSAAIFLVVVAARLHHKTPSKDPDHVLVPPLGPRQGVLGREAVDDVQQLVAVHDAAV